MDGLRQFGLLLKKNLILAWRFKIWTLMEFIVPIAITVPVFSFAATHRYPNDYYYGPTIFTSTRISGTIHDVYVDFNCMYSRPQYEVIIGYCADESESLAKEMMEEIVSRYPVRGSDSGRNSTLILRQFTSFSDMITDMKQVGSFYNYFYDADQCTDSTYWFGVYFQRLNQTSKKLSYTLTGVFNENFIYPLLRRQWNDPYSNNYNDLQFDYKNLVSVQFALDSIFIRHSTKEVISSMETQEIPLPDYMSDNMSYFVFFLPVAWGMCSFIAVVHGSREITQEKGTVRDFFSVMGLGTFTFYYSHIFFTWLKCIVIFLCCAIPIVVSVTQLSWTMFFFIMIFYALGAVTFGAMIAALFSTPNTTLKVVVILWTALIGVIYIYPPPPSNIGGCFAASLNINGALYYISRIIAIHMQRKKNVGWAEMFEAGSEQFTIGFALIMIIVDIIWMTILMFLFDYLTGSVEFSVRSMFFCCKPRREKREFHALADSYERNQELENGVADLEIEDLVKIWMETGERAVDGISLKAYRGQITAILGHNGAGKSTTFSTLCGLVKATSGEIRICGKNVASLKTRKDLGLCPQSNPLIDRLTVDEHLWLVHGLKGAKGDYKLESEPYLKQMLLVDKAGEWSKNLSGGMKRKLCVAMALIGNSPVVLLDEPTAGMDPGARRDIERLLAFEKQKRTILLTTHYMDEAETLGDRIAIMSRGRIVTCGSPQFLKQRFGTGYILSIVVDEHHHSSPEEFLHLTAKHVPDAKIGDIHGRQIELQLKKEEQEKFPGLFDELERKKDELGVTGFGLSINTLEQVFVHVCDLAEPTSKAEKAKIKALNQELILSQKDERHTGLLLWANQIYSILLKRILYSIRNWPQLIAQVFFPLLIFAFVTVLSQLSYGPSGARTRTFDLKSFGRTEAFLNAIEKSAASEAYYNFLSDEGAKTVTIIDIPLKLNISMDLLNHSFDAPPIGFGATFSTINKAWYNEHAIHAMPTSVNLISNSRLREKGDDGNIKTSLYAFPSGASDSYQLFSSNVINNILSPLIVVAMALLTSTFIMFLIEERTSKFTHQQSLTGISPIVFWFSTILYDLVFYLLMCGCFLIYFEASQWLTDYMGGVILLWLLYFWACMPFIYSISYLFKNASKANILLILYQLVAALAALLFIFLVSLLEALARKNKESSGIGVFTYICIDIFLCLIPSLGLGYGFFLLASFKLLYPNDWQTMNIWSFKFLGKDIMFMTLFGAVLWFLFFIFQFKIVRHLWYRTWNRGPKNYKDIAEDPDVSKERTIVEMEASSGKLALEVKDLTKCFGNFKAVDRLTMGIRNGECFGLLGVNGSGKTTTFDILTGQSFSTSGSAKIDNRNVTDHLAMGYCPQFDALLLDLTGKETLMIIARQYGFKNPLRKAKLVLNAVGLTEHGDKLVRHYSGGQRRKLSVGLALIATTRIIILDEPTAGIDPKARRDIWEVLTAVRDYSESALLLTSHSMEECEALCSRIAVLSKGHMVAIGTSQYLKSKYGNTYTLTIVANNVDQKEHFISAVRRTLPNAVLKTAHDENSLTMKWQIPRSFTDKWSEMFLKCQHLATDHNAKDFCLAQSTLEETFLVISSHDESIGYSPLQSSFQQLPETTRTPEPWDSNVVEREQRLQPENQKPFTTEYGAPGIANQCYDNDQNSDDFRM